MAHRVKVDLKTGQILEVEPLETSAGQAYWEPLVEVLYEDLFRTVGRRNQDLKIKGGEPFEIDPGTIPRAPARV